MRLFNNNIYSFFKKCNKNNWICHKSWFYEVNSIFFKIQKLIFADTKITAIIRKVTVYSAVFPFFLKYSDHCWCIFLIKPLSFYNLFVNWLFFSKHYVSYSSSFIKHFFVCSFNNRKFAFKTDRIKIKINWAFFFLCLQQRFSGKSTKTIKGNKILSDNKW